MATVRFYLAATGAADISPAFDAGWGYTSEATRIQFSNAKGVQAVAAGTLIGPHTAGQLALDRQYVTTDLGAGLTFTNGVDTMKCQILMLEGANTDNEDLPKIKVYVVDNAGTTIRATLFALASGVTNTELATTFRNVQFMNGLSGAGNAGVVAATYTTVSGDRLVIEVGYTGSGAQTTPEFQGKYGDLVATSDLPEDQTTTTDGVPWFEITYSTGVAAVASTLMMMGVGP